MTNGNEKVNGEIAFDQSGIVVGNKGGLTKREYFAAMAMSALLSRNSQDQPEAIGAVAVIYADELIEALNKEPSNE